MLISFEDEGNTSESGSAETGTGVVGTGVIFSRATCVTAARREFAAFLKKNNRFWAKDTWHKLKIKILIKMSFRILLLPLLSGRFKGGYHIT